MSVLAIVYAWSSGLVAGLLLDDRDRPPAGVLLGVSILWPVIVLSWVGWFAWAAAASAVRDRLAKRRDQ